MDATTAPVGADDLWRAAQWYRALPLTDRLPPPEQATGASIDGALRRLHAWKAQKPFGEALFDARLAADSLSESELLALLAEPAAALEARIPAVPDWLVGLRAAFTGPRDDQSALPDLEELAGDDVLAGCLPALAPLLRWGLASLRDRIETLRHDARRLPFDEALVPGMFVRNLAPLLLFQISKTVVLELHIARLRGTLQGEAPEARFDHFVRQLAEGEIAAICVKYPVLARQLVLTVSHWSAYLGEILNICVVIGRRSAARS